MRRALLTAILTAIASGGMLAQDSEQLDRCMGKANTQRAMNSCASEGALRAQTELNDIIQKLSLAARKERGPLTRFERPKGRGSPTVTPTQRRCIPQKTSRRHTVPYFRWKLAFFVLGWHDAR